MIIYKTTNKINGKIYIGQDSSNNPEYLGSGKIIKSAIKKYGKNNFTKEIIVTCSNKEELDLLEIHWISELNSTDPNIGYNISNGGNSPMKGKKHSQVSKDKISLIWKGKKRSIENIKNLSEAKKGCTHTDESKKKISEANKGRIPWNKGLKTEDVIKLKISEAKKGKKLTKEHSEKIANSNRGKKRSDEFKLKIKESWDKRRSSHDSYSIY